MPDKPFLESLPLPEQVEILQSIIGKLGFAITADGHKIDELTSLLDRANKLIGPLSTRVADAEQGMSKLAKQLENKVEQIRYLHATKGEK